MTNSLTPNALLTKSHGTFQYLKNNDSNIYPDKQLGGGVFLLKQSQPCKESSGISKITNGTGWCGPTGV